MIKHILSFILFLRIISNDVWAQTSETIQTDRPDQTECPFIVPTHYIQIENGFLIENLSEHTTNYAYPSTLWKYGLNERVELRLITELVSLKNDTVVTSGLNPITLGFKVSICQEKGIIPYTSFIGHMTTSNVGTAAFKTPSPAPSFRFTMQHTVSDKISLSYNLGCKWDGETAETTYLYTLATGFSLTEKLGMYIELYGFTPQHSKAEHRFDGGFTYLITNHLMVDLSGGLGITKNAPKNYLSLGLSYRFKPQIKNI